MSIFCVRFCLVVSVFLSIRFFLCFSANRFFFLLMCLNFKVNSCLFPMIFFFIPWKSLIIIFLHLYSIASSLYSRVFFFWVLRSLYRFCAIVPFFYAWTFIVLVFALYPSILWRKQYTNCKVCPYAFCNSHVNSSAWNKWQDKFKSLVQQQQKNMRN